MKDVTSTSFGLLIAYLLPGLAGLVVLSRESDTLGRLMERFLTTESSVGLFLIVLLVALAIGLEVTALRWILFECIICRSTKIPSNLFAELPSEAKLLAFRAAVDEYYRYHQFWGGMAIVFPLLACPWLATGWTQSFCSFTLRLLTILSIEGVTFAAAIISFRKYVTRTRPILEGANDA